MVRAAPFIDFLTAPVWIASTAATAVASFQIARRLFPRDKRGALAMHTILLSLAAIVLLSTVAGALGLLHPRLLLVASPAAQLAVLAAVHHARGQRGTLHTQTVSAMFSRRLPHVFVRSWGAALWLAVFSFVTAHLVMHGFGYFPSDYDSLAYHIPLVDHWIQTHTLAATDTAHWWLAANHELVALWIVGPFTGDFLIPLNNLPLIALWIAATLQLGRLLRLRRAVRHLGTLAIICVQPTFDEIARAANDLAVVAYWSTSLCYALRFARTNRSADLALFGISMGLAGGVKYFAAGYALVLFFAAGFTFVRRNGWRRASRELLFAVLFAMPFGGYWYVRNAVLTGSAIYPMGLRDALPDLGYSAGLWSTTLLGNRNPELPSACWQMLLTVMGPSPALCITVAPLTMAWLLGQVVRSGQAPGPQSALDGASLVFFAFVGATGIFAVTPLCVENAPGTLNQLYVGQTPARYGLCLWSISAVGLLYAAQSLAARAQRIWRRTMSVSVAAVALWQLCWHVAATSPRLAPFYAAHEILLLALNVALLALLATALPPPTTTKGSAYSIFAATVLIGAAAMATSRLSGSWHDGYAAHYDRLFSTDVFSKIAHRLPDAAAICVLDDRVYPFYGSRRQFRVCAPRRLTSPEALLRYLSLHRARFIATRRRDGTALDLYAETARCVDAFPETYVEFAGGSGIAVRRIMRAVP